jgi:nucleotide-binding universal stress UspA family protein
MTTWARSGPVVVEVDGTPTGRRAVDYATYEARRSGADLVLVAPTQPLGFTDPAAPDPAETLRSAATRVRELAGTEVGVTKLAVDGPRLKVLADAAQAARLLVVARMRIPGPQRLVTAHGDLFLTARAGCPVLVVPEGWRPSELDRRIAVGIDGTPTSLEAVEFAYRTAADRAGDLTLVHSQHTPRHLSLVSSPETRPADELTVAETLAGWGSSYPAVKLTRFLTTRPVVEALVDQGDQAGLVVIGAPAGLAPIGDPAVQRAVGSMSCPLAVVPHQDAVRRASAGAESMENQA